MTINSDKTSPQDTFEDIQDRIKNCTDIDSLKDGNSLFDLWKKAHEKEENYEETTVTKSHKKNSAKLRNTLDDLGIGYEERQCLIIDGIEQDSFVRDGYVDKDKYEKVSKKVLFVLKEANILCYRDPNEEPSSRSQVKWYAGEEDNRPKQLEKIGRMAFYLQNAGSNLNDRKCPSDEEIKNARQSCAFINLNKRGGDNFENTIHAYSERYQCFIRKQIELLNPDYIIILGNSDVSMLNLQGNFLRMWHPAYGMQRKKRKKRNCTQYGSDVNVDCYMREFFLRMEKSALIKKNSLPQSSIHPAIR